MTNTTSITTVSPADYRFWTDEKLRNADTDRQGHVNNVTVAVFFEAGRIEVLDHPDNAAIRRDHGVVVARQLIQYKKELFYPGVVRIGTRVSRIGTSSFDFEQVLIGADGVAATGEATCVLIDRVTRKPVALPASMKRHLTGRAD
jgi:acyl-CoA thioester hydrolase